MPQIFRRAKNISWDLPKKEEPLENLVLLIEGENQFVELNSSAALIWFWLDGTSSVRDISHKLAKHYNIPYFSAYEDVCEIMEFWQEDGLVFL
jgi:hypothetical protein